MAPRRKGKNTAPPLPMSTDGALILTKREVVQREIATAIRLYLAEGDPVAIHVLVSAAEEILHRMGLATGRDTTRTLFLDHIKDEYRRSVEDALAEPFNFMKHGSRDPDAKLFSFKPEINRFLIFYACADFLGQFRDGFPELALFMALMSVELPQAFKAGGQDDWADKVAAIRQLAGTEDVNRSAVLRALEKVDQAAQPL